MRNRIMTARNGMLLSLALAAAALLAPAARADEGPEATVRTSLSDDELGHLVNFFRLANQGLDDWSGWEAKDQEGMEAYRYQIAFMGYALALQQYHCVPAWREVHKPTLDRLIERILQKPVWEFWAEVSKTRRAYDPDWDGEKPSKRDPVGEKNIMYSGHIVHMAALYEMLYRDMKWSQPGAFTFRWDDKESYAYDQQSLLTLIRKEMLAPRDNGDACAAGVECEPNLIFPECNQHPLLAFQLNDHLRGTAMYPEAKKRLAEFFDCTKMYDPVTKNVANCYRVKQAKIIKVPGMASASANGWTGAFTHSWDPEVVRGAYETQKSKVILREPDGGIRMAFDPEFELGAGFFALLAVELGDMATAQELFAFADKNYDPIKEKGALRYQRKYTPKHKSGNTSDKVLALAKSNRPNGIVNLHGKPWGEAEFNHPLVEGVDFPRVLVSEARWNAEKKTLTIELAPGYEAPAEASFRVAGVKPGEGWALSIGGKPAGASGADGVVSGAIAKSAAPGAIEVKAPLKGRTRIELARTP